MGKKKKAFIDKKNAHTFQVVHRSQRDPLQADQDSSQHVLLPLEHGKQGNKDEEVGLSKKTKLEELKEFGVDFKDDYDYLQHLKQRTDCTLVPLPENVTVIESKTKSSNKEFGKLLLPTEAFASAYEEKEGLLNLAAPAPGPHPEWDPDVVAALDGEFDPNDPENELGDDFIIKANATVSEESDEDLIRSDDDDEKYFPSDEGEDFEGSGFSFGNEETKSRFTSYSMTSSVIRRNEGLTLLDDRFERVMEEYDEDEIGALDQEELTGTVDLDSQLLQSLVDDFQQKKTKVKFTDIESQDSQCKHRSRVGHESDSNEEKSDDDLMNIDVAPKEKWDCESILSTYSNLYNHPTLIKDTPKTIKLSNKTGIPIGVLPVKASKITRACEEPMDMSTVAVSGPRPKHENKEDKSQRKQAVKEERRARRAAKKTNKLTFKEEQMRQEQSLMNAEQQRGLKL